jgi:phosphatidylglycerol:prolipoprotein diacylglycerol transferase
MPRDVFVDIVFWALLAAAVGAKGWYVLQHGAGFAKSPPGLFGFSFLGGLLGGFPALYWRARRHGVDFLKFLDWLVVGLPLGHGIMKIGCLLSGCCGGKTLASCFGPVLSIGVLPEAWGDRQVPVRLLSAAFSFFLFGFLHRKTRRASLRGDVFYSYMVLQSMLIMASDCFTAREIRMWAGITPNQLIAAFFFLVGTVRFWRIRPRRHRKEEGV